MATVEKLKDYDWHGKAFAFYQNTACEAYPCHIGVDNENFNCLFCYCPLYALGGKCGGDFTYTKDGVKDCGNCVIPHDKENYGRIQDHIRDVIDMTRGS